jgi:hypothetical protein
MHFPHALRDALSAVSLADYFVSPPSVSSLDSAVLRNPVYALSA